MIDGNQLREEFGRYLAEHKATRWGMDAALMHVCKIAYDAGKADGPVGHRNGAAETLDKLLSDRMKRSVKVEQVLQDVADEKRPVLTPDECRALSLSLGTPDEAQTDAQRAMLADSDLMKEAERLSRVLEGIAQTALRGVENEQIRGHLMDAAALLAHIQRGAVPEGDDGKRVLREVFALCEDTEAKTYEEPGDFARGRRFEAKGIARAIGAWYQEEFCGRTHMGEPAVPAPDQFRDAAKMVPVHCTPTEHEGRIVYEHTSEPIPNADGFVLYAASADQFRTAAKMMAVQPACMTCSGHGMIGGLLPNGGGYESDPCPDCTAPAPTEVLMPKPVAYGFGNTAITGHTNRLMMVRIDIPGGDQYAGAFWLPLVLADEAHTYGIACRAAGEAAGYARGLTEAGREAKRLADAIVREVAELPDRDSPADWPAAMLVTSDELRGIVLAALRGKVKP
ncbi:MAG: hypothetical protein ACOY9J_13475 [Pseudomonadota bacterium]